MDLKLLWAPFEQMLTAPACALIILPISIVAFVWEMNQATPSKYIPIVCLFLGMILYPALTSISTVPPGFPIPLLVLVLNGFVVGFVAWLVHKFLIKKLIEKFAPVQTATKEVAQAVKDAPSIVVPPNTVVITPPDPNLPPKP